MDEQKIESMAMFRYSVIAPLLNLDDGLVLVREMKRLAGKVWILPDGRPRQFAWGTIEDWYYDYRRNGVAGLKKGARRDAGTFRALDNAVCDRIDELLKRHPGAIGSNIVRVLKKEKLMSGRKPSRSTVYRYIRANRPAVEEGTVQRERRSFEAPYAGDLWQTDILYGPFMKVKDDRGRQCRKQTYLVAILDDHSRLLCHAQFYLAQNLLAYLDCLKKAIGKRGIPRRLYCDNGQVFTSDHVSRIAAGIAMQISHTAIGDAAAKGKIEIFFRRVRNQFLGMFRLTKTPESIEELNRQFALWSEDYNNTVHSATETTPITRWLATSYKVRLISPLELDRAFVFEDFRKVRKDGTFPFSGNRYETDCHLAGKKVKIQYDPFFPERISVSYEGQSYGRANPLDRQYNASGKRRKLI